MENRFTGTVNFNLRAFSFRSCNLHDFYIIKTYRKGYVKIYLQSLFTWIFAEPVKES